MQFLNNLINQNAFSLEPNLKSKLFLKYINLLTAHHYKKSHLYKDYLSGINYKLKKKNRNLDEIPFLPVRLFKDFDFLSIKKKEIFKTLLSSGTSSNKLSKIYIDKNNAFNQMKVLQKIFYNLIGNSRLPMLVIDKENTKMDRKSFNASAAAISGFSIFANKIVYLLNQENKIDYNKLNNFLKQNINEKFLIFGFTSNIYLNLIKKINPAKLYSKDFSNALLVHGGGWKKMEDQKIHRKQFNLLLKKKLSIENVRNYYGLVEQIGSIFFECSCGYFIASNYSDIIIRDENLEISKKGKVGLVQLLSLLPSSYPGHSILTDDIGEIVDDYKCNCFGHGKRFLIHGRLKDAELRGCSNI